MTGHHWPILLARDHSRCAAPCQVVCLASWPVFKKQAELLWVDRICADSTRVSAASEQGVGWPKALR